MAKDKIYVAIDLKSFYASVECQERGLDPLHTHLVVADASRSSKTICLAVSPSLKALGVSGRPRLFEVEHVVENINRQRQRNIHWHDFRSSSIYDTDLDDPYTKIDYVVAPPRMAFYMEYSTKIYQIYLRYVAKEDIHVYSIDEVFIDVTSYLSLYKTNAHDFTRLLIQEVLHETGITATAGIGTNLFLAKCAMDIVAKHIPADQDGVRIAYLDEMTFRKQLWTHEPLTDFWRIGKGIARKLQNEGIYTMGDIARVSIGKFEDYYNEDLLYKMFGVNAELIIDHAWGYESCTMEDIKTFKPSMNSSGIGQVLKEGYTYESARMIVKEMAEQLSLNLVSKQLVTKSVSLHVGYDNASVEDESFHGEVEQDYYGRLVPKSVNGRAQLSQYTSSMQMIKNAMIAIFEKIVNSKLLIRRISVNAIDVVDKDKVNDQMYAQMDLFTSVDSPSMNESKDNEKDERASQAILKIKEKYGANAILKVMDLQEDATAKERNEQIGGHKA